MHEFDSKDLKRLFGIPASQIRALIRAGHIHPLKKAGRLSYSFQDLIVCAPRGRCAPPRFRRNASTAPCAQIRESLPGELPLCGLSITAIGDRIVVREGRALRESDSGQYTLALDVIEQGGDLLVIDQRDEKRDAAATERGTPARRRGHAAGSADAADAEFEKALALEETDPGRARRL